jgi:hypothetical protein
MSSKPWPADRVQIVCSKPEHFNYATCQGERCESICEDCSNRISYDSYSLQFAKESYPQFVMEPRLICTDCLQQYRRADITHLHDLRRQA